MKKGLLIFLLSIFYFNDIFAQEFPLEQKETLFALKTGIFNPLFNNITLEIEKHLVRNISLSVRFGVGILGEPIIINSIKSIKKEDYNYQNYGLINFFKIGSKFYFFKNSDANKFVGFAVKPEIFGRIGGYTETIIIYKNKYRSAELNSSYLGAMLNVSFQFNINDFLFLEPGISFGQVLFIHFVTRQYGFDEQIIENKFFSYGVSGGVESSGLPGHAISHIGNFSINLNLGYRFFKK